MKFNKKILIGLLTASCVVAGTFGLAACKAGEKGEKGEKGDTPVITIGSDGHWYVDGVDTGVSAKGNDGASLVYIAKIGDEFVAFYSDGTSQTVPNIETELQAGVNEIDLPSDALAAYGITYTYTADAVGDYLIYADSTNAKITVNNEVVSGMYTVTLGEGDKVEIKCSTVDGKKGSYNLTVAVPTALSLEHATTVVVPALNDYAVLSVEVPEAGEYTVTLNDQTGMADYTLSVNGVERTAGLIDDYTVKLGLEQGKNVILLTSSMPANMLKGATVGISLEKYVPLVVQVGNNTVNASCFGTVYTFTAPETAAYTFSVDENDTNIDSVTFNEDYDNILEPTDGVYSLTLVLKAGEEVAVNCIGTSDGVSFDIDVAKSAAPSSGEAEWIGRLQQSEEVSLVAGSNNTITLTLKNLPANKYVLYLIASNENQTAEVKVGSDAAVSVEFNTLTSGVTRAIHLFTVTDATAALTITITCPEGSVLSLSANLDPSSN